MPTNELEEKRRAARNSAIHAFEADMPLLMHGAGDNLEVDPDAARMLAILTTDYISDLVDAALDAHKLAHGGVLPPPPPPPFTKKRKKTEGTDYWDEPLAEPNLRGRTKNPEWYGVEGVSFRGIREAYTEDTALSPRSFLFPVCHDAYAFGKVRQLQKAEEQMRGVLQESTILEMVRTIDDKDENEEEVDRWPGLESLLPMQGEPTFSDP